MFVRARGATALSGCTVVEHRTASLTRQQFRSASPFSTSTRQHDAPKPQLSKVKRAERVDKLAQKRNVRAIRRERDVKKLELARMAEHRRVEELHEKRQVAQDISDSLPPFSEEQLESMYQGLLTASPSELAAPLLAAPPAAPALPDPAVESRRRGERLSLLEQRLAELEGEIEQESTIGVEQGSLAHRLRERQGLKRDEGIPQELSKQDDSVPVVAGSPARVLLDRVENLLPVAAAEADGAIPSTAAGGPLELALPRGALAQTEWADLVLSCAEQGDREGVERGLRLMDRLTPISDGKVLEETLALYSADGRAQDALALAAFARQNSLPLSVQAHHHLLTALLASHPELALRHLQSMEVAGHTPLLPTFTAVVHRLLSPFSPPHLVRAGWDLYAHTRAVAYPVPDAQLFSTMIVACSTGPHPSPDRAIDLFTEMTHDNRLPSSEMAFNGVIRACSREGSQEYYYEALRHMRRMLDDNVAPSRQTFHALLEGAQRHGDLARARWMLVKMVGLGGEVGPTGKTMALVLQAYAAFRPESRARQAKRRPEVGREAEVGQATGAAPGQAEERRGPSSSLDPLDDPTTLSSSASSASTQAVIELLGEASLFYPGPMPQTSAEVLVEARNLLLQVVDASVLSSSAASSHSSESAESSPSPSMFPQVQPSTFLLNSYLSVLNSHAPLPQTLDFFSTSYAALALPKNRFSYKLVMRRCELAKNKEEGVVAAKRVFEEWLMWKDEPFPVQDGEQDLGAAGSLQRERMLWLKERSDGRSASKMWGGMIRVLARALKEDEALSVLKRFVSLYPPTALSSGVTLPALPPKPSTRPSQSLALPPLPIRLSSSLYPETAPPLDALRPPFLTFKDLQLLHLRLANMEDKEGLSFVKWVGKAYEAALVLARKAEAKREK
ncbi:hypothetical protein JCM11641_008020 [Rhodosporidiobolus odoratus]